MRTPRPFANPPVALTSVAVLLIAAIVVGVILIRADDRPDAPGPTAAKASTSAPSINECVLGSWTAFRAITKVLIDDDIVEFTSESGVRWQFNPDGTGRYDFGSGSTYVGSHEGDQITYVYDGEVTFTFSTEPAMQLALRDLRLGAETGGMVSVRGKSVEADISLREDRLGYTCSGNSLSLVDEVKEIELRRA
jgi:hypothetical protein